VLVMLTRESIGKYILSAILALLLAGCSTGSAGQPATPAVKPSRLPDPDEVKELLVQMVDVEKRTPGIVVGMIADDPQESWVVGYGRLSDTDERVPDGDTVFELASIGKVFTGTLLAQAVVHGDVQLDDPISMYLPERVTAPEYEGKSITLLDLATHTSGLPWSGIEPRHSSYTLDQMYDFLSEYRLNRAPGSSYEYSGFGMGLLGNLLVRETGVEDYEALLVDRITGPLGMDSTHIVLTPEMRSRLSPPHRTYSRPAPSLDAPTFAGAGAGLRSTANDLLTFLAANMGLTGTELQPALQLANTPQRPSFGKATIGLGWKFPGWSFMIGDSRSGIPGNTFRYHGGGNPGYSTYLAWDPEAKVGIVVLANASYASVDMDHVVRLLISKSPFTLGQDAPKDLASYAGRYQDPNGNIVTFRIDGTRIFIQLPDGPEYEIFASAENHFYLPVSDLEITFYRNDLGEVDRVVGVVDGVTHEAKKLP
jgi:D-alanyl-D-alanine-carboxypeptidase/D-alanyl-D-alanine-endopeptidase